MEKAKEMKDYYSILGVSKDADEVVIKAAYKALAQKYHPDKSQSETAASSTKLMSDINKAYSILENKNSREKYDLEHEISFMKKGTPEDKSVNKSTNNLSNFLKDQIIPDADTWRALGLGFVLFLSALFLGVLFSS